MEETNMILSSSYVKMGIMNTYSHANLYNGEEFQVRLTRTPNLHYGAGQHIQLCGDKSTLSFIRGCLPGTTDPYKDDGIYKDIVDTLLNKHKKDSIDYIKRDNSKYVFCHLQKHGRVTGSLKYTIVQCPEDARFSWTGGRFGHFVLKANQKRVFLCEKSMIGLTKSSRKDFRYEDDIKGYAYHVCLEGKPITKQKLEDELYTVKSRIAGTEKLIEGYITKIGSCCDHISRHIKEVDILESKLKSL